ncbi:MAG TPA: SDR family oxidoreductase [Ktedonobacteraceae bacterium]|nr:SDR family oxidoreductase [Ktedonobacteraceae bacterium]
MTLKNFAGSVAVVTGGASGIGLATARALYAQGAHVVLADINSEGLQQAAQLVHQSNPSSTAHIIAVVTDVADEEKVRELMRQALDTCGRIDLVVCSAGIGRGGPIDTFTAAEMQTIMNINFMGIYHCVQAALPAMRHQQDGHFVFLSSVAGKLGSPMLSAYCATKWAVRGFSIALRAELHGTGIGITTVYPAWVDTPMIHQENDDIQNMTIVALLTPEQVADEILQAVLEEKRDLTLAPNPDIAMILEIMKEDPDKAEMLSGEAFRQRMQQLAAQQSG